MNTPRKNILVYPRPYFVEDLIELKENGEILITLVLQKASTENRWLVRRDDLSQTDNPKKNSNRFSLRLMSLENSVHPSRMQLQTDFLSDGHLYLEIDDPNKPYRISGFLKYENETLNIDELFLVGAGMDKIPTINSNFLFTKDRYEKFLVSDEAKVAWQMTRKALGEEVWKKICLTKFMIVGCGRSGETLFGELANLGVGNIVVCDGDSIELRNLGEMKLAGVADVGRNKAEAIVEKVMNLLKLNKNNQFTSFRAIPTFNFDSYEAQKAAQEVDIIICCVDSDAGRSYTSYIASRYHKVLLDIGTGILREGNAIIKDNMIDNQARRRLNYGQNNEITMGYDVRLILPTDGCLECCGGLDEIQSEIEMFNREERNRQRRNGHLLRVGSLSNLNSAAVSQALQLLFELFQGKIKNSIWVQYDNVNGLRIQSPIVRIEKENCDCKKAGLGNLFFNSKNSV